MYNYTIMPICQSQAPFKLAASDAYAALTAIERRAVPEADIYEDGVYAFTARRGSQDGGCWVIHTRHEMLDAKLPAEAA